MKPRDVFDFFLLAAIWGGSFLFMKLSGPEFGVFLSMALRTGLAALILIPLILMRGLGGQFALHWKKTLGIGVLNSGLPFVLFAFATLYLTAGFTAILNSTVPFWSALIAWLWLGDKPKRLQVLGLGVAFVGVIMLVWGKLDLKPGGMGWAILACLLATLLYGFSANMTKRLFTAVNPLVAASGSQVGAALCLLPFALANLPDRNPSSSAWAAVICLALVCTALAYVLYFRLMRNLGPTRATAVTFLIPVFGMLWGWLFLQEVVSARMVLATLVILTGTSMSTGLLSFDKTRLRT
jgi:drug/metabolite transporter (DMT)-like permease